MNLDIISNISKISSETWNNLNINDHPFTNYDFLYALEESKSVCAETGWLPPVSYTHLTLPTTIAV